MLRLMPSGEVRETAQVIDCRRNWNGKWRRVAPMAGAIPGAKFSGLKLRACRRVMPADQKVIGIPGGLLTSLFSEFGTWQAARLNGVLTNSRAASVSMFCAEMRGRSS